MAKFVLLYSGGGMPETEEENARVMKAWEDWYASLGAAVLDGGDPFTPEAKSVASDGTISDGPGSLMASGYTILEAESLDEAAKMATSCPILQSNGTVSVFGTIQMG
jgi:hypothetical protein